MDYLQHLRSLAETQLADYDVRDAVDALREVDNMTPADLPDNLLVRIARRYLETIDDPEGGDAAAALRETLFGS